MRHWSGKFQKLRNFRLKHRWVFVDVSVHLWSQAGNLNLKIWVFGIKTGDSGREGSHKNRFFILLILPADTG
ncbi:hypothetical protein B0A63_25100 [Flavobacterium johnsoniae UW101]|nr:hypothetical protein B0A63_25100 [Flavobacterium johnsoniae UW101]